MKPWKNKKCAVVLTYDDALNIHLDNVIPLLDSLGMKGTFYVSGYFPGFRERMQDWKSAAKKGHELGNHTLYHPCEGGYSGREWVNPEYDLRYYSVQRMVDEIQMANVLLESVDGKKQRTFAYPCGDMKAGDSSYVEEIKKDFISARGVWGKIESIDSIDLFNIGCFMMNGNSGEEMISLVKKAMENNALVVFLFHGVGGEHPINVSEDDHKILLKYLKQHEKDIWVAPLVNISQYIMEQRKP